ncbi:hypothetical protein RBWH47_05708 [Rhodopirellula baltica WH47]|uniref:Uncharacterized protein n=1 Tax=Rhodopirellula baltica WH47 TaxID=991778 RepID=F2B0Z0_RHOBT|nr:hypothetical protein RBWH47_05708 [Rhodopirellula baltica WH47]
MGHEMNEWKAGTARENSQFHKSCFSGSRMQWIFVRRDALV